MTSVLIVCSANSIRSQIAEGLWRAQDSTLEEISSAGAFGAGSVHPLAIKVMQEIGIDIGDQESKSIRFFQGREFDVLVTVCDRAREIAAGQVHAKQHIHWSIADPTLCGPSEEERIAAFRMVRDDLKKKIQELHLRNR